jgi:hypothetical protein
MWPRNHGTDPSTEWAEDQALQRVLLWGFFFLPSINVAEMFAILFAGPCLPMPADAVISRT